MKISRRASNFSLFSDDLWLVAENDGTTINFDVCQGELLDYALSLLDVADDCLRKSEADTDDIESRLCAVVEDIHNAKRAKEMA